MVQKICHVPLEEHFTNGETDVANDTVELKDNLNWFLGFDNAQIIRYGEKWSVGLTVTKENDRTLVKILGSAENVENVKKKIEYLGSAQAFENYEIPSNLAGLVIGTGGAKRREIEQKCDVGIKTPPPPSPQSKEKQSGNAVFTIYGLPTDRSRAMGYIREITESANKNKHSDYETDEDRRPRMSTRGEGEYTDTSASEQEDLSEAVEPRSRKQVRFQPPRKENQEIPNVTKTPINERTYNEISKDNLGFFTANHKPTIERNFGVKINIDYNDGVIKITGGTDEQLEKAIEEIKVRKSLIEMFRKNTQALKDSCENVNKKDEIMRLDKIEREKICLENNIRSVRLPTHNCDFVIGKKGRTIKQVQQDSGTWIISEYVIDGRGFLEIYGSSESVEVAQKIISEIKPGGKPKSRSPSISSEEDEQMDQAKVIKIEEDATGYGYAKVYQRCARKPTDKITITEPYVYREHEIDNMYQFCLDMKKIFKQKRIKITLRTYPHEKVHLLVELLEELAKMGVDLTLEISSNKIRRAIDFCNGCTVKCEAGIDLYKPVSGPVMNRVLDQVPCRGAEIVFLFDKSYFDKGSHIQT